MYVLQFEKTCTYCSSKHNVRKLICTKAEKYHSRYEIQNTRFEIRDSKFEILYSISKLANQILELKPVSLLHKTVLNKDH